MPKSKWSVKNKELAQTLIRKGLMTRQGLEAIERAKESGAWDQVARVLIDDEQIAMFKAVIQPYEAAYTNLLAMSHSVQRNIHRILSRCQIRQNPPGAAGKDY
jgi:uncharacterized protein YdeI (YjbR/CyaY-like superfamily)